MMSKRILPIVLIVVMLVAGCQEKKNDSESPSPEPLDNVKIQLFWNPDVEFAPLYAAQQQGFFQSEGLNVELMHGGYDENGEFIEVMPLVLGGQADFGLTTGDQILLARAKGEPIVAIAVFLQNIPTGFYSLAEKQITTPEDLKGKRVWIWGEDVSYEIFFHKTGLQPTDVTEITDEAMRGETGYDGLIDGSVDAMIGFIYYEPNALTALGYPNNFILFHDYGVEIYPDVIFTTEQMIQEKPEVVQAFINGTLRGIRYVLDEPGSTAEYIKAEYADEMVGISADQLNTYLLAENLLIAPINSPLASRPGMMSLEAWQVAYDDMMDLGLFTDPFDLSKAFDTHFVEAYYAGK